jgi:hypothetical protein
MVMRIQVEVYRLVTPSNDVVGYDPCYLSLQGEVNGAGERGTHIGREYKRVKMEAARSFEMFES